MSILKIITVLFCFSIFLKITAADDELNKAYAILQIVYNKKLNETAKILNNDQLPRCRKCQTLLNISSQTPPQGYGRECNGRESSPLIEIQCLLCGKNSTHGNLFLVGDVYLHEQCSAALKTMYCDDCRPPLVQDHSEECTVWDLCFCSDEVCKLLLCCPCIFIACLWGHN